jgi:hypothetical protein
MSILGGRPGRHRHPPHDPGARRLYVAIRDAVNAMDWNVKIKFMAAFQEQPEWSDLDPDLQAVFSEVAAGQR